MSTVQAQSPQALEQRLQLCAACHGADGNSQAPGTPSIAGQPQTFLETQLVLFREELRVAPQMQPAVTGLSDPDIIRIAKHFSALPARAAPGTTDQALFARGRGAAQKLLCGTCHLADFRGQAQIPRLAGQREEYLAETMLAYRDNRRTGGDTMMAGVLYRVPDAEIRAMAHFLARSR